MMNIQFYPHPIWAMAFRPLYLCAAFYGIWAIFLWGFGYQGTPDMPSFYWHAHEMIWGYGGAVVVGFLLTASATWTKQPPVSGIVLMIIVFLWIAARIGANLPYGASWSGISGTAYFVVAAWRMGASVWKSRNTRNYIAVFALLIFGSSHVWFHVHLLKMDSVALSAGLSAGLLMVAGFIGLIGSRVIPFFTAKRLGTEQLSSPYGVNFAALLLPMLSALLLLSDRVKYLSAALLIAAGVLGLIQTVRWWVKGTAKEPMLWTLHIGYALTALGLLVFGLSYWWRIYHSMGVHLIAVGGIGLLTLSMMSRTALGHTGRSLYPAPRLMPTAFGLMVAAALVRILAAWMAYVNAVAYLHTIRFSAILFAAALLLYIWRYLPWLVSSRIDGKSG